MEFHEFTPLEADTCDELWELYEKAFPRDEREPKSIILRGLESGHCGLVGVRFPDGRLGGFCNFQILTSPLSLFVVYVAVGSPFRGQGLGKSLMDHAASEGTRMALDLGFGAPGYLWLETEIPLAGDSPEKLAEKRKRQLFFERQGFRVEDIRYVQPPVDGESLVPMQIMGRALSGGAVSPKVSIREHVRALLKQKYEAINGIDCSATRALLENP